MQILDHNFTEHIFNLGLLVCGLTVVLLTIVTLIHWLKDRWIDHSMLFDRFKRPMIMSYLDGNTPKLTVIKAIEKEPTQAMNLLLNISRDLQPYAQARLLPIFEGLPGVEKELDAIDSPLTRRRIAAAERLGLLQTQDSDDALLEALKDDVIAVRYNAACSLAEHGRAHHLKDILDAFDDEHEINWFRLVEVTLRYGLDAVPTLLEVLDKPDRHHSHNIVNVAIRSLGNLKEKQAIEPLIRLLKHVDMSIRLNAAHALGDIGDLRASAALAELSRDPEWTVRFDAIEAMGKLHDMQQMPGLVEALGDSSFWVRYTAAQSIYNMRPDGPETLRAIMRGTHDPFVHDACADILSEHQVLDPNPIKQGQANPIMP